jgi:hypothetical protein
MVGKAQKPYGARSGLYGGYFNGVPLVHFSKLNTEFKSYLTPYDFWAFPTKKRELRGKKF